MDERDPILAEHSAGSWLRALQRDQHVKCCQRELFQSFASLQLVESTVSPSQSNKRISGEIHPSATQAQLWEGSGAQGQGKEPQGKPRAAVRALPVLRAAPPQRHPEGQQELRAP